MRFGFVTLFPDLVRACFGTSVLGRAVERGLISVEVADPRDFAYDRHRTVDDTPYGGGPGMLMKVEPLALALASLEPTEGSAVVATDPAGHPFTQEVACELSRFEHVVFACGRYEGFDERFVRRHATHRLSIGDYILTGGELPALVMADAVGRLVPGVLGDPGSLEQDSHSGDGLLGPPNYTRPPEYEGLAVPEVLLSGDHKAIAEWRRQESLKSTRKRRPDLLTRVRLEKGDSNRLSS